MRGFELVGKVEDFREGRGTVVIVEGTRVAVFRVGGALHAISDACPHMGASLADGKLEGSKVVCHWHGWTFDLDSGRTKEREWACANVYEVRLRGNAVYLKAPPPPPEREAEPEEWVVFDPERHLKSGAAGDDEPE